MSHAATITTTAGVSSSAEGWLGDSGLTHDTGVADARDVLRRGRWAHKGGAAGPTRATTAPPISRRSFFATQKMASMWQVASDQLRTSRAEFQNAL
jgi:hypothetical protein